MAWWGKILGGAFGYLLGGPLGAALGAAMGHNFDRGMAGNFEPVREGPAGHHEGVQGAFFTATFAVMGHLGKIDGRVTHSEIDVARRVMARMDLNPMQVEAAKRLFDQGKSPDFPLQAVLAQLRSAIGQRRNLLFMFIEIQLTLACADGAINPAERRLLLEICNRLGVPERVYRELEAMANAQARHEERAESRGAASLDLEQAYALLNVQPGASDAEVKKSYRRLMSRHHPDKLVANGLPEEMITIATEKTREIRAAYEKIREARGF
ncbi:MAG: co-chaperone DjlA [Gammaproteobacteria bacterium]